MKIIESKREEYEKYKEANKDDAYSNRVVTYGEYWAELMEGDIEEKGVLTKKDAEAASDEADTDGITGFMYGAARQALVYFWVYGEALREVLVNNVAKVDIKKE